MYAPTDFREADFETIAALMRRHPLGALVTFQNGALAADHIPFMFDAERRVLRGHVARANPVWRHADPAHEVLVIFSGLDHYVSPSWYPTKKKTGKVVPTWNYEVVHVHGRMRAIDDPSHVRALVEDLTREHEEKRQAPWAVADAPEDFIAAQIAAVMGIEIAVARIEAKRKLSQNRAQEDRAGVIDGLLSEKDQDAREMAQRITTRSAE